jgi:hypothetical protein
MSLDFESVSKILEKSLDWYEEGLNLELAEPVEAYLAVQAGALLCRQADCQTILNSDSIKLALARISEPDIRLRRGQGQYFPSYHHLVAEIGLDLAMWADENPLSEEWADRQAAARELLRGTKRYMSRERISKFRSELLRERAKFEPRGTIWYHGEQSYSTDGKNPRGVSQEEHFFLQVFLEAGGVALGTVAIQTRVTARFLAELSNVSRVAQNVEKKFPGCVRMPGENKNAGYSVSVRGI